MDEDPLSFDIPPTRTVDVQGAKFSISINTTGNERTSFTVVLCCAANGVEIRANENGWMNEQIMLSWLQNIWRKCKILFSSKGIFNYEQIAIIPGGLTKKLQPLDVSINRSFKSKVRKLWEQWMSDGEKRTIQKRENREAGII
ncbi:pogo transposable element with KRAB [Trichonephila clavipes]|nr:pogo transposable element with KRAB [Trichonephila clavipes]